MSSGRKRKRIGISVWLYGESGKQLEQRLEELSRETGLNRCALIRAMIAGTELKHRESPDLWELKRTADRIRNDLNQLTFLAVRDGTVPETELPAIRDEISRIRELLEKLE